MAQLVQPVDGTASEGEEKMKTEASDYTVQFEILGSNVLYAAGKILGLSGRRTNNNNFLGTIKVRSVARFG
jgi:hypothetical protein